VAATPFQASLRDVNDHRRVLFGDSDRMIVFVCECHRTSCLEAVLMSAAEFDARRPGAILVAGHET
jgi:hypothetical protein